VGCYLGLQDHGRQPLDDQIWNAHDVFVAASDHRSQNPGKRDAWTELIWNSP
jgi:hypothetical protein